MKNKGFTLIELLAVIVILSIIALIAVPIILGIIKDSKDESNKRSVEMYGKSIENALVKEQFGGEKGIVGSFNTSTIETKLNVEYDGESVVCDIIEVYEDGNIYLSDCKINGETVDYVFGKKQIMVGKFNSVCELASDSTVQGYEAGAKYNCKVAPNKDTYTFYVLKTPSAGSTTIDLIMDQNINSDGTPAGITGITKEENPQQYNLLAWFNEDGLASNEYGPVTAINFLYNATKNWTNVSPLNFEYKDKEEQGVGSDVQIGYTSFKSENGILTITGKSTTKIGINSIPLRARLPIYSNNADKVEVFNKTDLTYFLYDNSKEIGVPNSYWLLSSYAIDMPGGSYGGRFVGYAYLGSFVGRVLSTDVAAENGIRPVITLDI